MTDLKTKREELHAKLKEICEHVYFQTPANIQLEYPCIVYELIDIPNRSADNRSYFRNLTYQISVIEKTKDSDMAFKILDNIPYSSFSNTFENGMLYHTVFTVNKV